MSRLLEGEAVELRQPLLLKRLHPLKVTVVPDSDLEERPWSVRLHLLGAPDALITVATGLSDAGRWISPPLPPGEYLVQILDSRQRQLASEFIGVDEGRHEVERRLPAVRSPGWSPSSWSTAFRWVLYVLFSRSS